MSKIASNGLNRSGTWMLYSCTHMARLGVKGLNIKRKVCRLQFCVCIKANTNS